MCSALELWDHVRYIKSFYYYIIMTNGILKDKELDIRGGASLYKTLSSAPLGNFTYHPFTASWTVLPSAAVEHP